MRAAVFTVLKIAALVALYLVLFSAGAALFVTDAMRGSDAPSAYSGLVLVGVALFDVCLLAVIAARSRLSGWRLAVLLAAVFYFVKTFTSTLEAAYFMKNVSPEMIPALFSMTAPLALLLPPAVALAFGPPAAAQPAWVRPPMSTTELVVKVAVLSIIVYPVLFFGFGYFVAWQSPALREFYGAGADVGFFTHFSRMFAADPVVIPFEWLRGLLWVACAAAVLRTTRGPAWVGGVLVALLFALVQNDVHLLPNPLMPPEVRFMHFWETSTSNALNAAAIAWLLTRSHAHLFRPAPRVLERMAASHP